MCPVVVPSVRTTGGRLQTLMSDSSVNVAVVR
jgi:hypothetical protein